MRRRTRGVQQGLVIFRERIPDFTLLEGDGGRMKDDLPLFVEHTCPTGCIDAPNTPTDLSSHLPAIPQFPRDNSQSESFRTGMFNQLYAWYACYEMLKKYEMVNNHTYDIIIRHRFDAALWMDYPVLTDIPENTIYIPKGFRLRRDQRPHVDQRQEGRGCRLLHPPPTFPQGIRAEPVLPDARPDVGARDHSG